MSGQRPDEEDEEQEEEGEQQGLFLANAQHVVFDGDELENESAEEHPMLTPSSLAPSSEGGSQFADDDCEDTATAHDEVGMASLQMHSCHSPSSSSQLAHITLLIPIHSMQM